MDPGLKITQKSSSKVFNDEDNHETTRVEISFGVLFGEWPSLEQFNRFYDTFFGLCKQTLFIK